MSNSLQIIEQLRRTKSPLAQLAADRLELTEVKLAQSISHAVKAEQRHEVMLENYELAARECVIALRQVCLKLGEVCPAEKKNLMKAPDIMTGIIEEMRRQR